LGDGPAEQMPAFAADGGTKLSAGWLIERAGFCKGYPSSSSPARLSTKHTLALTNRGTATAEDVIALAREVRDGVREAFGVELHPEPGGVGCHIWPGPPGARFIATARPSECDSRSGPRGRRAIRGA